jgi:hypothetical protein
MGCASGKELRPYEPVPPSRNQAPAEPTRITFATDKGTGQWNVTTGKVTCLLPPGVENTAKPLWSPHEISRLRMMIAHVAIQREGAVALMGKIAVRSSTNYSPNSLNAQQPTRKRCTRARSGACCVLSVGAMLHCRARLGSPLGRYACSFIDDVLMWSKHAAHVRAVFDLLAKHDLL